MTPKLVSTIIPVFNRPAMLREAVQSVLDQTYRPIEIVIVDDGSTDSTPDVIRELQRAAPGVIRAIRQQNAGPGASREAGRLAAHGEFIQYLDSDDLLLPSKFALQVAALGAQPECGIAYGKTQFAWAGQAPAAQAYRGTGKKHETLFPSFLVSRWWCTQTPLYRRSLTDAIGAWTNLWSEEDWEYDARAASLGTRLCFCDDFVSVQRGHQPEHHLSHASATDPRKLVDRAAAHESILRHAQKAGVVPEQPEMKHFARELFLLSRQCGAAGLESQSKRLLELSIEASGMGAVQHLDLHFYKGLAALVGWTRMGRLSKRVDQWRAILRS
jgi:GT2 family glycosyltransferase